jgi:ribosomal protein S18 acetylase RimI-like enzyme
MGLNIVELSVHEDNIAALKIYTKAGFKITGEHPYIHGKKELEMQIMPEQFYGLNVDFSLKGTQFT